MGLVAWLGPATALRQETTRHEPEFLESEQEEPVVGPPEEEAQESRLPSTLTEKRVSWRRTLVRRKEFDPK
jgi:uncharacterized protein YfaQ (DUF2300 family)